MNLSKQRPSTNITGNGKGNRLKNAYPAQVPTDWNKGARQDVSQDTDQITKSDRFPSPVVNKGSKSNSIYVADVNEENKHDYAQAAYNALKDSVTKLRKRNYGD